MSGYDLDDVPNWRGRDVVDENGHAVGVITDLYVDDATGRPEWAMVKSGLFSHHVTFVPLSAASAHGMRVQVPFDQRHIHDAPKLDHPEGRLSADEEARLYAHYGLEYGPAAPGAAPSGAGAEFIAPATDRIEEEAPRRLRRHAPAGEE
jgi:hypothetical protein